MRSGRAIGRLLVAALAALMAASAPAADARPTLLVIGDSLSAAYGIDLDAGWVALLERRLAAAGAPHRVVNASVSGDTTNGGLRRLPGALERHRPDIVVIELGGNDGLRGIPPGVTEANLRAMVERAQAAGARVILVGMRLPPNLGPAFTEAFEAMFPGIARDLGAALVPFLLDGVATVPGLMQSDGLHPTADAQPRILDNVWPHLEPLLEGAWLRTPEAGAVLAAR